MSLKTAVPILIIAYKFPPFPGVGGRRWAKFASCLAKLGHPVYVICAENPQSSESLWSEDIKHKNIKVYSYPSKYPFYLNKTGGFVHKLRSKLKLWQLNTFSKGTPFDMAVLDEETIQKLAESLIVTYDIKHIIATGAPFRILYYAALLKEKFNLQYIADFRDPWTWGTTYGFSTLSDTKMKEEKRMEKKVISAADTVFVPVHPMLSHLEQNYPQYTSKIKLLPHAFDSDETGIYPRNTSGNKVKLIHIGTIYYTSKEVIEDLAAALVLRKNEVELHFYSSETTFKDIFEKYNLLGTTVKYFDPVSPKELFKLIRSYNYFLLIHVKVGANYISTKFYEVIATQTPILFIAPDGITSTFVKENNVGLHWQLNEVKESFKNLKNIDFSFNLNFNLADYTFMELTKNMLLPALGVNTEAEEDSFNNKTDNPHTFI